MARLSRGVDRDVDVVAAGSRRECAEHHTHLGGAAGDDQLRASRRHDGAPHARFLPGVDGGAHDDRRRWVRGGELGDDRSPRLGSDPRDDRRDAELSRGARELRDAPSRLRELELPEWANLVIDEQECGVLSRQTIVRGIERGGNRRSLVRELPSLRRPVRPTVRPVTPTALSRTTVHWSDPMIPSI